MLIRRSLTILVIWPSHLYKGPNAVLFILIPDPAISQTLISLVDQGLTKLAQFKDLPLPAVNLDELIVPHKEDHVPHKPFGHFNALLEENIAECPNQHRH